MLLFKKSKPRCTENFQHTLDGMPNTGFTLHATSTTEGLNYVVHKESTKQLEGWKLCLQGNRWRSLFVAEEGTINWYLS